MKNIELLAPAGKVENAYAAIENGADALFIGGKFFSARQYADNFTDDELEKIINYSKLRAVKVYITVNTLIKQEECRALFEYLYYLYTLGIDAIISQDLAVIALVKKYFPNLSLHASTQMSAHSLKDVKLLESLGFKRIVLARELNLSEISYITKHTQMEIETFVHGALCYSYSGQCLMSSLIGGRSGNRGRCAQPCRMKYTLENNRIAITESSYLMSLKDICTIEFLPQLIHSGIHSFKIEGRMKSPEYVASAVKTYRKYIDLVIAQESYQVDPQDIEDLKGVFNRGGFSTGYYFDSPSSKMVTPISPKHRGVKAGEVVQILSKPRRIAILLNCKLEPGDGIEIIRAGRESVGAGISKPYKKGEILYLSLDHYVDIGSEVYLTKNHQLLKSLRNTYNASTRTVPIDMKVRGVVGEPIEIEIRYKDLYVYYKGDLLQKASSAPITQEKASKQFAKLGNTSFKLNTLTMNWDETGYIAISKLNEIRREALIKMQNQIIAPASIAKPIYQAPKIEQKNTSISWSACVRNIDQLQACLESELLTQIYWEWQEDNILNEQAYDLCQKSHKQFYLALPYVIHDKNYQAIEESLIYWEAKSIAGYLIRNYGSFYALRSSMKKKIVDYNLNVMNNEAISMLYAMGASRITLSMELISEECKVLEGNLEKVVYGYIPVMLSKQCILGHYHKCIKKKDNQDFYYLKDRKDAKWLIQTDCQNCVMHLLTNQPIVLKSVQEFRDTSISCLRLNFSVESREQTQVILRAYSSGDASQIKDIQGTAFKFIE